MRINKRSQKITGGCFPTIPDDGRLFRDEEGDLGMVEKTLGCYIVFEENGITSFELHCIGNWSYADDVDLKVVLRNKSKRKPVRKSISYLTERDEDVIRDLYVHACHSGDSSLKHACVQVLVFHDLDELKSLNNDFLLGIDVQAFSEAIK